MTGTRRVNFVRDAWSWLVDGRQFAFWLCVVFIAGAGPNLAQLIHPLVLVGGTVLAGAFAFFFWSRDKRRTGVGVYLHFSASGKPGHHMPLSVIGSLMETRHRDWFRAGPDRPGELLLDRAEWMMRTVQYRLDEMQIRSRGVPALHLYMHCELAEAFTLGQYVSKTWGGYGHDVAELGPPPEVPSFIDWHINAISHRSPDTPYRLNLSRIDDAPNPLDSHISVESVGDTTKMKDNRAHRLGVLVFAVEDESDHRGFRSFVELATEAVIEGRPNGYLIERDDVCNRVLAIRVSPQGLFESLRDHLSDKAAGYLAAIRREWLNYAAQEYGTTDVQVRLILRGPSILAFALAMILPEGTKFVAWSRVQAEPRHTPSDLGMVAIIDGDDVGVEMERELIGRNVDAAINYGEHVTGAMQALVARIEGASGFKVLMSGGDSMIVSFPTGMEVTLEQTLEIVRRELGYEFSCGYGRDSREAYLALRAAKTQGKNRTNRYIA